MPGVWCEWWLSGWVGGVGNACVCVSGGFQVGVGGVGNACVCVSGGFQVGVGGVGWCWRWVMRACGGGGFQVGVGAVGMACVCVSGGFQVGVGAVGNACVCVSGGFQWFVEAWVGVGGWVCVVCVSGGFQVGVGGVGNACVCVSGGFQVGVGAVGNACVCVSGGFQVGVGAWLGCVCVSVGFQVGVGAWLLELLSADSSDVCCGNEITPFPICGMPAFSSLGKNCVDSSHLDGQGTFSLFRTEVISFFLGWATYVFMPFCLTKIRRQSPVLFPCTCYPSAPMLDARKYSLKMASKFKKFKDAMLKGLKQVITAQ
ncbi:hypothetical protein HNY73_015082 [Argiope bruennichi]|uniref:Uncharacterized protein n=1 Tax=Argiope bruennichi TaxID=94029 RepID=A0A8T0ESI9_ARGBR|nr:hypothetical protein HNY73_015082 [Argiope bruennichi]